MQAPELYTHLLRQLNATGIRYMVTGGVAATIYGEPRLTNDVDLVVALRAGDAELLVNAFPSPAYYTPPADVIREEVARPAWGHFNVLHAASALRADIYPVGEDALGAWGMAHRQPVDVAGDTIWMAPIEYVILKKLMYYRDGSSERHIRDISAMLRLSGELINRPVLSSWLQRLELEHEWSVASSDRPDD